MKIASADWNANEGNTNFGGTSGSSIELGSGFKMAAGGGSSDIAITLPEDGSYNFHFNAADKAAPIVTVTKN